MLRVFKRSSLKYTSAIVGYACYALTNCSVFWSPTVAYACGGIFDVECNLKHGGMSPENLRRQTEKAQRDLGPFGPWIAPNVVPPFDVAERCLRDLSHCPKELVARAAYEVAKPIVDQYLNFLSSQTSGNNYKLPDDFISTAQPYYSVNLNKVRYSLRVNTVHRQAITVGYRIYFPRNIDLDDSDDIELMYHELEHVVQYEQKGGIEPFLAEYIAKGFAKIIEKRSVNIHDDIDIERAAIDKAALVSEKTKGREFYFSNSCNDTIRLALSYKDIHNQWRTTGYWKLDNGEKTHLVDNNVRLRSRNSIYYIYAESLNRSRTWSGNKYLTVDTDGRRLGFLEKHEDADAAKLGTNFTCN
ncbi:DUF1036 domain-containing protein [Rhizobium binxianense]|uniref:DUF1036 domain-containing protein n=1 Tax=Rhizobium binxianense TaxID=3024242 RepID=UPI0023611455|nr:DUF1036 domain-containing protein [Rhizobium sp. MJ37]MDC9835538.1 DUF1036 domain-containing protein [Rhizobium sp. MJ37]